MNYRKICEKDLETLENITNSVGVLHDKLCKLMIEDKIDTDEYRTTFDYLQIALEVEDDYYKSMNLDYHTIISLSQYISRGIKNDFVEAIINQNYKNRNKYRISKKLLRCLYSDEALLKRYIEEVCEIMDVDIEEVLLENNLEMALQRDISRLFAYYIQELINNSLYDEYKKQLIMTKFLWYFIEGNISILEPSNILFTVSEFNIVSNYYGLFNEDKEEFIYDTQDLDIKDNIKKLFKVPNKKNLKKNTALKLLLRQCYIRAILEKLPLIQLAELSDGLERSIVKKNLYETHPYSTSLIINSIRDTTKTKLIKRNINKKTKF